MPRGNPNFGRQVKSPGRPPAKPKDESVAGSQAEMDEFIRKNLMKYVKVQHDIALDTKASNPVRLQATETLISRLLGKERHESPESALIGLVRDLIGLKKASETQVIDVSPEVVTPKELPPGNTAA